jgi:hypothetical protein
VSSQDSGLPVEFVTAVAAMAGPGTAVALFASDQARVLPTGPDRERLLTGLLALAFHESAPIWLLEAAIDQGLGSKDERWAGSGIDLAATALAHPGCDSDVRGAALRGCTDVQLAALGTMRRPEALVAAVTAELRRRSPEPRPMTRDLLAQPTPPQKVLQTEKLADAVFDAALELLPVTPEPQARTDTDTDGEDRRRQFTEDLDAWKAMWRTVLEHQPDRYQLLVERTDGGPANYTIRHLLLGTMPWRVEPSLLNDLASADFDDFRSAVLTTQVCRALRGGASEQDVREHFTDQIDSLSKRGRQDIDLYLREDGFDPEWGCHEATGWASSAVKGQWRLLLNPAEARPAYYGDPYAWLASPADLEGLGRAFAEKTVEALMLWEPDQDHYVDRPVLLRWIVELLTHLPRVTDEVKAAARPIAADARKTLRIAGYNRTRYEDTADLEELVSRIEKIIADPAPDIASRRKALGDPTQVTVRELSGASAEVISDYLDRHAEDGLVEKILLAIVSTSNGEKSDFGDVLSRHSNPDTAIREMTHELRRRLGGNPAAREQWAQEVLALPTCDQQLIRALPAWTALKLSGIVVS